MPRARGGGIPDIDFKEGIAIVSHPNGPELAIAQVFQQMRTAQATPISYATPEGPATNSGHRNPPRHIPDFEKNQLLYLGPDLPHS